MVEDNGAGVGADCGADSSADSGANSGADCGADSGAIVLDHATCWSNVSQVKTNHVSDTE